MSRIVRVVPDEEELVGEAQDAAVLTQTPDHLSLQNSPPLTGRRH